MNSEEKGSSKETQIRLTRIEATCVAHSGSMDRLIRRVDEIHDALYKDGLSARVSALENWQRDVKKIILAIITAILISIATSFYNAPSHEQMRKIEHLIDKIEQKNTP